MKQIKPASTVQVFRDHPENGLETLLLRRNSALAFASGFWVFPGGKIEPNEIEQCDSELASAKIAGVRETLEESNLNLDINDLNYFIRWTTPLASKIRFKTYFFHALIPFEKSKVIVDDSEILEYKWLAAEKAIALAIKKDVLLLPPTFISLQRILHCKTYTEVKLEWNRTKPMDVTPTIAVEGSKIHCIYKGDDAYESLDFNQGIARHRLIVDQKSASFQFLYENCEDHFPLNGLKK